MEIGVSNRVVKRDSFGRFRAECDEAGQRTARRAVQLGAKISRTLAPIGTKHDRRTIPLKQSISWRMTGSNSGEWIATARHALPIEFGAAPHLIHGNPHLSFYWESAGKQYVPAAVYYNDPEAISVVNHPGNAAQPYLRPAYESVMAGVMRIAQEEYPG